MPASHFQGRLLPGCCALRSTRRTLLQLSTRGAGEVVGRIPVGRNPASVLVMQGYRFRGMQRYWRGDGGPGGKSDRCGFHSVGHQIL